MFAGVGCQRCPDGGEHNGLVKVIDVLMVSNYFSFIVECLKGYNRMPCKLFTAFKRKNNINRTLGFLCSE